MKAYKNKYDLHSGKARNPVILKVTGREYGLTVAEAFRLAGELIAAANEVIENDQK